MDVQKLFKYLKFTFSLLSLLMSHLTPKMRRKQLYLRENVTGFYHASEIEHLFANKCYLHLFRFPDAAVRVDVGDVDGGVALVAADAAPDPHAERLPRVLADGDGLLRQLRALYPQRGLQKLRHLVVHVVIRHHRRRAWKI